MPGNHENGVTKFHRISESFVVLLLLLLIQTRVLDQSSDDCLNQAGLTLSDVINWLSLERNYIRTKTKRERDRESFVVNHEYKGRKKTLSERMIDKKHELIRQDEFNQQELLELHVVEK